MAETCRSHRHACTGLALRGCSICRAVVQANGVVADATDVLVADERDPVAAGRTSTELDDRFIALVASPHPAAVASFALMVYVVWGIVLPVWLGASEAWRISFNTEGAIFAAAVLFARVIPVIERRLRHQRLELTTDVRKLSAREFEELAGELFRIEGWDVDETGRHGGPDGNIDLVLSRGSQRRLVQCKRWTARDIGVELIRELGGTLLREGHPGDDGIFVTCARYTPAAIREAGHLGIELIDGPALLKRLETAGAVGLVTAAEQTSTPWACPECATPMVLDRSAHGWWLRCPSYNAGCRGKHDLGQDSRAVIDRLIHGA